MWTATWQNQQSDCAPSEDSDQPGHPTSLIRVFDVRLMGSKGPKLSSCEQRRLWSDWADAQADLSLRWAHTQFVGFVMSRLIVYLSYNIITESCWFTATEVHGFYVYMHYSISWLLEFYFNFYSGIGKNYKLLLLLLHEIYSKLIYTHTCINIFI